MYDDLIKQLRYCADTTTCRHCPWRSECCLHDAQRKAADAIEELSKRVPPVPHGRLIDADEPIPLIDTRGRKVEVTVAHIIEKNSGIVKAIIPAEEGEK